MRFVKTFAQKTLFALSLCFCLGGCARQCNKLDRQMQTSDRWYEVKQYSGGQLVNSWTFRGILDNQEHSDGYFWYQGDTLMEVSGTVSVRSWK